MKITLLPDTRPESGFGHLRRCQALATELGWLGCECGWANDPGVVPDAVVIDDYREHEHDELFRSLLQYTGCCVIRFDDGQLLDNPADIVINGAPGAESLSYHLNDGATALLGPRHLCLDPVIVNMPKRGVRDTVGIIIISLGANPPEGIFRRIQGAVNDAAPSNVRMKLVIQPTLNQREHLQWLASADLAITGGGRTMLESVALGVPTIAIVMGDNQRAQVENLFAEGAVEGGIPWDSPNLVPSLQSCVQMVVAQTGLRQYMSEAGRCLIDGRGAGRVAGVIVERAKRQCV